MDELDLDLRQPSESPLGPRPGPPGGRFRLLIAALVVGIALLGGYLAYRQWAGAPATEAVTPAASTEADTNPVPLGGPAEAIEVPPLDESDAFVRDLVAKLSSDPRLLAWLATDGLIRTFTVVVVNIAGGETPSPHLRMMRPLSGFRASPQGGGLVLDPRSFERYNAVADAAASVDPAGSARLYTTLKPRIEEAYRDLGYPDTSFDETLEQAIVVLLRTPVLDGPVRLVESGGTSYAFENTDLEKLSAAQKQLLRMGPRNVRIIQAALRSIAGALGIPDSRLPAVS